ncbi:MAG: LptF/LptG family permease [Parachlamydiaceae bacterium]|nr:LptF/LptG family permease [Parachlamydiaceae bacterium]
MFKMIWERYFIKEFLKIFFLFITCFYGLYIIIDYSSHTNASSTLPLEKQELIRYYFYLFSSRAEILIPLALILAFVKTVCTLNNQQELAAFMACGFPLKVLMRPFLVAGFTCMFILYLNEQFILPTALKKLKRIESGKHQKNHRIPDVSVKNFFLEDGSIVLYQDYDPDKDEFFDVYWIQSIDKLYRIKFFLPNLPTPIGKFVDLIERQENGELLQVKAYPELTFPEIRFNREALQSTLLDPEILSLTDLFSQTKIISPSLNEKESKLLTAFYWKLIIPFLCLLAILAPAPFCVKFSRQSPQFLIYVCSIFGLIAFYMLIDAAQIISKRQVIEPIWALGFPFLCVFTFFTWRYLKIKTS